MDLDQTIIHTTVDPTVGEWMKDIEEDDREDNSSDSGDPERIGRDSEKAKELSESKMTPPSTTTSPPKWKAIREKNPNAAALKDVAKFQLADDLPPGYMGQIPGRWYYTKPR